MAKKELALRLKVELFGEEEASPQGIAAGDLFDQSGGSQALPLLSLHRKDETRAPRSAAAKSLRSLSAVGNWLSGGSRLSVVPQQSMEHGQEGALAVGPSSVEEEEAASPHVAAEAVAGDALEKAAEPELPPVTLSRKAIQMGASASGW